MCGGNKQVDWEESDDSRRNHETTFALPAPAEKPWTTLNPQILGG